MKKLILGTILLVSVISAYSYQWPTNKDFLQSLFGNYTDGSIDDGITFYSNEQAIYPLADGEVIFYLDSFNFGDLEYKGNEGNLLILNHIGDFKSIYRNFITRNDFEYDIQIAKSEMIGLSGNASDSFIFSIFDNKKDAYINPQQILPFMLDERKPVINGVFINNYEGTTKLHRDIVISSGAATIAINAWDVSLINNVYRKMTPFSINVFIDGFEKYNASFSSIKNIEGSLYLSGDKDVLLEDVFVGDEMIYGGEVYLTTGRSLIEIVIKDIYGNETSKSYSVVVE